MCNSRNNPSKRVVQRLPLWHQQIDFGFAFLSVNAGCLYLVARLDLRETVSVSRWTPLGYDLRTLIKTSSLSQWDRSWTWSRRSWSLLCSWNQLRREEKPNAPRLLRWSLSTAALHQSRRRYGHPHVLTHTTGLTGSRWDVKLAHICRILHKHCLDRLIRFN